MKRVKRARSSTSTKRSQVVQQYGISSSGLIHIPSPTTKPTHFGITAVRHFSRESDSDNSSTKKSSTLSARRRVKPTFSDSEKGVFEVSSGIQIEVEGIPESVIAGHDKSKVDVSSSSSDLTAKPGSKAKRTRQTKTPSQGKDGESGGKLKSKSSSKKDDLIQTSKDPLVDKLLTAALKSKGKHVSSLSSPSPSPSSGSKLQSKDQSPHRPVRSDGEYDNDNLGTPKDDDQIRNIAQQFVGRGHAKNHGDNNNKNKNNKGIDTTHDDDDDDHDDDDSGSRSRHRQVDLPSRAKGKNRDIIFSLARHPDLEDDDMNGWDFGDDDDFSDFSDYTSTSSFSHDEFHRYHRSHHGSSGDDSDSFANTLRKAAEHRKHTLESAINEKKVSLGKSNGGSANQNDNSGSSSSSSSNSNNSSSGNDDSTKKPPGDAAPGSKSSSSSTDQVKAIVPHGSNAPKLSSVIVLPSSSRPLFPGLYYPTVVRDPQLVKDILAQTKKGLPYVGVFMRKGHSLDSFMKNKSYIQSGDKKNPPIDNPIYEDSEGNKVDIDSIHRVGTFAQIFRATPIENGALNIILVGLRRIEITTPRQTAPYLVAEVKHIDEYNRFNRVYTPDGFLKTPEEIAADEDAIRAYSTEIMVTLKEIIKSSHIFSEQLGFLMNNVDWSNPSTLADICATMTTAEPDQLQEILSTYDVVKRLHSTLTLLKKELQLSKLQRDIQKKVEETLSKNQREFLLKEQLKNIKRELGYEKDDKEALQTKFRSRLEGKTIPDDIKTVIDDELNKLASLEGTSMEFNITRNYLDWLTSIPWGIKAEENYDVHNAENILNEDHYGMQDVKDRILEFVSVGKLLESTSQGKIMLFVGPPGVGKTSIGKSIAKALNRPFYRFSVGGLGDVSEIKGHRRTYVGAMPGKIVQALKKAACVNPVVLIDEIDKIGRSSHHGDPSSALLEVLDPEQNNTFMDHYLDVPIDLSKVLFLCTANTLDTIPGPLLDRMDVVRLSGYVQEEKEHIAKHYLEPSLRTKCGVGDRGSIEPSAISHLIKWYSREAGVRNLQKFMEQIYRKMAFRIVRGDPTPIHVNINNLSDFVGQEVYTHERLYPRTPVGVVMGLAWSNSGGSVLYLESAVSNAILEQTHQGKANKASDKNGKSVDVTNATDAVIISEVNDNDTKSDKGKKGKTKQKKDDAATTSADERDFGTLKVTGQLGDVMKESTAIAYTLAKMYLHRLHHDESLMKTQGAVPLGESDTPIDPYHCVQPELRPPVKNTTTQYSKAIQQDDTLFNRLQKIKDDPLHSDILSPSSSIETALQPPPNQEYINPDTQAIQPSYIPIADHNFFATHHIHIHVPQGSIPKDGPSAGVALVSCLLSQALGRPLVKDLAMTGEVTLTGKVLPIGGVKEKTIAARRAGVMHIMAPKANVKDFAELPLYITSEMTVYFPDTIDEAIRLVFGAPYALGGKDAPPTMVKKYPKFDGNIEVELLKDEQRTREQNAQTKDASSSSSSLSSSPSSATTTTTTERKTKPTKRKAKKSTSNSTDLIDESDGATNDDTAKQSSPGKASKTSKGTKTAKVAKKKTKSTSTEGGSEQASQSQSPINGTTHTQTQSEATPATKKTSKKKTATKPTDSDVNSNKRQQSSSDTHDDDNNTNNNDSQHDVVPSKSPSSKSSTKRKTSSSTSSSTTPPSTSSDIESSSQSQPQSTQKPQPPPQSELGKLRAQQNKRIKQITSTSPSYISSHGDIIKQIVSTIVDDPILHKTSKDPLGKKKPRGRKPKSQKNDIDGIPDADILFETVDDDNNINSNNDDDTHASKPTQSKPKSKSTSSTKSSSSSTSSTKQKKSQSKTRKDKA